MRSMYDIAAQVAAWSASGERVHVAQVISTRGFSSSDPSAALAWTGTGEVIGGLLPGLDDDLPRTGDRLGGRLAEITVSDADAVAAGLSCGGAATVFVQDAAAYPETLWAQLERREPVCLVHELTASDPGRTAVYTRDDVRDAVHHPGGHGIPRQFARGTGAASSTVDGDTTLAVITLWPPTTLVVVGHGSIADALADVGALLGWTTVVTTKDVADVVAALTESDAAVVLSHDRAVDVPALAAVLSSRTGYVGALGSRPTQAARAEGLTGRGVPAETIARIRGPAGLDLDAHTPGEIAVSIVAEILAVRAGTSGGSLSGRPGPIHTAGVHAPPPR